MKKCIKNNPAIIFWTVIIALLTHCSLFVIPKAIGDNLVFINEPADKQPDQWDKLIFYKESEECPVVYRRDPYKRYRVISWEIQCEPRFESPELSILKPRCFYMILTPPEGLINTLYSQRCHIHLINQGENI